MGMVQVVRQKRLRNWYNPSFQKKSIIMFWRVCLNKYIVIRDYERRYDRNMGEIEESERINLIDGF
jgi:hypothetical protein